MHQLHHRRLVRSLVAGSTAALLALSAACGSSTGDGGDSSSSSSKSSGSSTSSDSSESSGPLTTSDIGDRLTSAQQKAGTFSYEIDADAAGQKIQGTGMADITGSEPATEATIGLSGDTVEAITVDGFYYLKSAALKLDKPWLKIDPNAKSGIGAVLGQVSSSSDPRKSLEALDKASKVTKTGEKKVGGTDTTVYEVSVPGTAAGEALGYPKTLVKELPDSLDFTIYVDEDDLVRRQEFSLKVLGQSTSTMITFDDYGDKVSISAPPADETTSKAPAFPGATG